MKKLFDKTQIGKMKLKNRFICSSIGDNVIGGHLNEEIIEKYSNFAKGGVGTIITGIALVDEVEKSAPMFSMFEDSYIAEYKELTDKVHEYDTNIVMQLCYGGSFTLGDVTGRDVLGPSAVEHLLTKIVPKEININEMKAIQDKFAQAALRAKKAGFDAIEIQAAHGVLLGQFITPYYNHRNDIYGGTIENRARMLLETYSAVRKAVGEEYPIWIKINSTDGIEDGMSFDDCKYVCKELAKLGANAIEISGNWIALSASKEIYFKDESAIIAEENDIAVIVTGGNRSYEKMEELLNTSSIEYFGMARPFISDSDFVNKYEKDPLVKSKCISCNACLNHDNYGKCILNKNNSTTR